MHIRKIAATHFSEMEKRKKKKQQQQKRLKKTQQEEYVSLY